MNNRTIYLETKPDYIKERYKGNITVKSKTYNFTIDYFPKRMLPIEENVFVSFGSINSIYDDFTTEEELDQIEQEIIEQFKKGR